MGKKSPEFKPITYFKRSIQFDGRNRMRCTRCGGHRVFYPPPYPSMPLEQFQWTQAYNMEIGNFFTQHERCGLETE